MLGLRMLAPSLVETMRGDPILNGSMPSRSSWEPERRVIAIRRQLTRLRKRRDFLRARLEKWQTRLARGVTPKRRTKVAEYTQALAKVITERKHLKVLLDYATDLYVEQKAKRIVYARQSARRDLDDEKMRALRRKMRRP